MKFIKYIISILIIFSFCVCLSSVIQAEGLGDAFTKADTVAQGAGYGGDPDIMSTIGTIITIALSMLGVVFLVLLIYGGYTWMTARGNEQQVEKAKSTINTALIGLVIVLVAYAASYFIISKLSEGALGGQPFSTVLDDPNF